MKHLLLILSFLVYTTTVQAQEHCDGTRYIEPVFSEIDSTLNVSFGENTTVGGDLKNLRMDIYYPAQEFFFRRPVVVLAHGGSFISGNRKQLRLLCHTLAYHGFVATSIDYRLYDDLNQQVDSIIVYDVVVKAASDMKAAVRWFKESASTTNEFGIDSNLIIVGGVSAGAITALQYAFLDTNDYTTGSALDSVIQANGGIRGTSNNLFDFSEDIIGVLNYSGALKEAQWIDPSEPTVFSVHDEFDPVVPYGQDVTTELGTPVEVSGSAAVHEAALEDGIRSQLITIEGSNDHVGYFLNGTSTSDYANVIDSSMRFLEYTICDRISGRRAPSITSFTVFPNPAHEKIQVKAVFPIQQLMLFSLQGSLVCSTNADQIWLSDLSSGNYILEIQGKQGELVRERVVVF